MMKNSDKTMEKIVALCKTRGFIFPGSEIYGGLANSWARQIIDHTDQKHKRNASDDPDEDARRLFDSLHLAHAAEGKRKPQRDGKQKCQEEQKTSQAEAAEQIQRNL